MPNSIQKRAILITACFLEFFVNISTGPSKLFGLPNTLLIMALGQALHGLIDPFLLVPALPEMLEAAVEQYPD